MTDVTAPVSVVIPCFLCCDSIERAILSVVRQTVLPCEIVLVDDASPDDGETVRELERLVELYGGAVRVRLILSELNGGPGSARNRGWEVSTQPFVAFLDADDAWGPRKIEIQYAWMRDHPDYKLTCHRHVQSTSTDMNKPQVSVNMEDIAWTPIKASALLYSNALATRTVMIQTDLPFRFEEHKRYAEDYLLWLEMVYNGVHAAKIEIPLALSFKRDFGVGGLSENLWKMELGELDCFMQLYKNGLIGMLTLSGACSYSLVKFVRRKFIMVTT